MGVNSECCVQHTLVAHVVNTELAVVCSTDLLSRKDMR